MGGRSGYSMSNQDQDYGQGSDGQDGDARRDAGRAAGPPVEVGPGELAAAFGLSRSTFVRAVARGWICRPGSRAGEGAERVLLLVFGRRRSSPSCARR